MAVEYKDESTPAMRVKAKIRNFEEKYGLSENIHLLYGKVDDMELIEWEGELKTLARLEKRLAAFEGIHAKLATLARQEGVSLNTLVLTFIAEGLGMRKEKRNAHT